MAEGDNILDNVDPRKMDEFGRMIIAVAADAGAVLVERSICPHCKTVNLHAHIWTEILICQEETCGKRYPSLMPRPPIPGELQLCHLQAALCSLHRGAMKMQADGLTPLTLEEVEKMPEETKGFLRRHYATVVRSVTEKATAVANLFAEQGMKET